MKKLCLLAALLMALGGFARVGEDYPLGSDSQRQPGVPQGAVTKYTWTSKIFPGTVRDYWVYVPAQYAPDTPACVMVFQDGKNYVGEDGRARIPIVFDNLIARHDMPVTIAIMIDPGLLKAASPGQQDRVNRSYEYDGLSDRYARFLLDEILPEVAKHYNLSTNPNDRAIAGASSGGICSFTVAWTHPEAFRRVLSFIGSFADLRGGDIYPALIRKTEPKPLRVFLQDGSHDLNNFAGDWYLANQSMASALTFAGYDVKFVTGDKNHDMIQGGAIMPDALRWLWRDYPQPIAKAKMKSLGDPKSGFAGTDSDWQLVAVKGKVGPPRPDPFSFDIFHDSRAGSAADIATDARGNVYFRNASDEALYQIDPDGYVSTLREKVKGIGGLAAGVDGRVYACEPQGLVSYASDGSQRVHKKGLLCWALSSTPGGGFYFSTAQLPNFGFSYLPPSGPPVPVSLAADMPGEKGVMMPTGLCLSPDGSLLYVGENRGKWIWSFQVEPGGSLARGEPFIRLDTTDEAWAIGAGGMAVNRQGLLFVTTQIGIQVCDQQGRVVAILDWPDDAPSFLHARSGVSIGGANFDYLFLVAGNKVFRRHLVRRGGP